MSDHAERALEADGHGESMPGALLSVRDLRAGYGALPVLHGVSFDVAVGETAVVLGLNGAGKTTTMLAICGALAPWSGSITFDGAEATGWDTGTAVTAGVVLVPEGRRVFPELSVARNLQVGAWSRRGDQRWVEAQQARVYDYFPRLRERGAQLAGTLSGGEQQMLAIARGLMAGPRLLIIDEASMGLAPALVADLFDIVGEISADGTAVLLVEQNVAALRVADVGLLMEQGRIVAELRGDDLGDAARVRSAFLG